MALEFLPTKKLQPSTNERRGAGPVAGIQPETSPLELLGSAGNGRDEENAITFLEAAGFAPEEANVFFVEIDVEELANLTLIVAHVARKIGEPRGEFIQSLGDGGGATVYFWRAASKATERCRDFNDYGHFQFSLDEISLYALAPAAVVPSCASRYASNASRRGAIASVAGNSAAMASVVFRPLPVMQTTVVSSGLMRFWAMSFCVTPAVTPPAVSVKMPSVSARSLMAATISGSEMSSAQPPDSRICLMAKGPSAGLPMASERAMVLGFCGSKRARLRLTPSEMGEQPVACAPKNFTGLASTQPSVTSSRNALAILVMSEPPAMGTTTLSGSRQPSCSAISKPCVFEPSE